MSSAAPARTGSPLRHSGVVRVSSTCPARHGCGCSIASTCSWLYDPEVDRRGAPSSPPSTSSASRRPPLPSKATQMMSSSGARPRAESMRRSELLDDFDPHSTRRAALPSEVSTTSRSTRRSSERICLFASAAASASSEARPSSGDFQTRSCRARPDPPGSGPSRGTWGCRIRARLHPGNVEQDAVRYSRKQGSRGSSPTQSGRWGPWNQTRVPSRCADGAGTL